MVDIPTTLNIEILSEINFSVAWNKKLKSLKYLNI